MWRGAHGRLAAIAIRISATTPRRGRSWSAGSDPGFVIEE
jgi:hypothetical protein